MTGGPVAASLAAAVARAEQALAAARTALTAPTIDPLETSRQLRQADTELDAALEPRCATPRSAPPGRGSCWRRRCRRPGPRSPPPKASSTPDVGRSAGQARALLADAQRRLARAEELAEPDPVAALAEAQQAERLAEQAGLAARSDVDQWRTPGGYRAPGPGGFAGPGSGGEAALGGLAGAILGGILVGGGPRHGGFGGGGFRRRWIRRWRLRRRPAGRWRRVQPGRLRRLQPARRRRPLLTPAPCLRGSARPGTWGLPWSAPEYHRSPRSCRSHGHLSRSALLRARATPTTGAV